MDAKTFLIWAIIVVIIVAIILLMVKNNKPKMMRHRPPLILGRGNANMNNNDTNSVAPKTESFSDQYTMNVPINQTDPLYMASVPVDSPFIGDARVRQRKHYGHAYGHVNKPVIAPITESFTDQYTMNVPINTENPLYMNSVPDSLVNPWTAAPESGY